MKSGVAILGATGSIGQNTLSVLLQHREHFEVVALTAQASMDLLFAQCGIWRPKYVVVPSMYASDFRTKLSLSNLSTQVLVGERGLCEVVRLPEVEKVMMAIPGSAGLQPTLAAVRQGKTVLMANKEVLVMGGDWIVSEAKRTRAILLPVDSEHQALFQCMPKDYVLGTRPSEVSEWVLTASGGPFLHFSSEALAKVTPEQACQHPRWKMGKKITVDCATLMNKGLEVIEAGRWFQCTAEEVSVVVHPESIVHSLVVYRDGASLAQLSVPDMRVSISHCLAYPRRILSGAPALSLTQVGRLSFEEPDFKRFPCLGLAYEAMRLARAAPCVLNASNEVAVEAFMNRQIAFTDIASVVESALQALYDLPADSLEAVIEADRLAREKASDKLKRSALCL